MKRLLKFLKWTLLVVIILLGGLLATAYIYKGEILATIKEELRKNVNGEVDFRDITLNIFAEFPDISVTLHDLYIRGPRHKEYPHDFLRAGKVYVKVELSPLFVGRVVLQSIRVTEAEVYVFKSKSGYTNLDVFRRKTVVDTTSKNTSVDVSFNHILLQNVALFYRDSIKNKMVGLTCLNVTNDILEQDSSLHYAVSGQIRFEGLMLNPEKGSYLRDKLATVNFDLLSTPSAQRLIVNKSQLIFEKSTVQLDGKFEFKAPGQFQLNINSDNLNYPEGLSILTEALQRKLNPFDIVNPIELQVVLAGQLSNGGEPKVDVAFDFSDSPVSLFTKMKFKDLTASGAFTNHIDSTADRGDENSRITIKSAHLNYLGLPVQLQAVLTDLKDPLVEAEATIDANLRQTGAYEDTSQLKIKSGKFLSKIKYKGMLKELLDSTATTKKAQVKGSVQIVNGAISYLPRKHDYRKINMLLEFDQSHATLDSLKFELNGSPVLIKGETVGFLPFFVHPSGPGSVKLKVFSPSLNMSTLLAKDPNAQAKKTNKKPSRSVLGDFYGQVQFEMEIDVRKLTYKNLVGNNLNGKITLAKNNLSTKNFSMKLAGGDVSLSATMQQVFSPMSPVYLNSRVRNADIKKFFYSFDNFKLKSPTHQNLEGKIDTEVVFWAWVDDEFTVHVPSVVSQVHLTIRNGRIVDFAPLQNMSNFLMKNRDFSDVHFGVITSQLSVKGTEIDISRMEVESSVLRLFLEGRYSLKDSTDMSVQVPLSNLKKRDKNYKPENVGVDAKVGPSVFLHVYDDKGKMAIAYDPFKKHVRKDPGQTKKK